MKITDVKVHPVISLYEKHGKEIVFLEGFAGAKTTTAIRLYPELTARTYFEIPAAAILHIEKCCEDCGDDGRIKVYMAADMEIKSVQSKKAKDYIIIHDNWPFQNLADTIVTRPNIVSGIDILKSPCVQECKQMVEQTPGYTKVIDGGGVFLVVVTPAGRAALAECLKRCGYGSSKVLQLVIDAIEKLVSPPQP